MNRQNLPGFPCAPERSRTSRSAPLLSLILLCALALAACSGSSGITSYINPYRIDVRQGNLVTQEMVAQLKPGMSRDQVRFVLGTPLVNDVFHTDRWDYVYRFRPGRGEIQQRRLSVFFSEGKLARVAGDVVATDSAASSAANTSPTPAGEAANAVRP